ncbi:hypothetical protein TWF694_010052 [Orbilia ellipsospora]|uniref:Exonuclease domain-containing protein n=1 Tax=Orbilia ellipsospora TaxID=2528407 RepID=A0AAV9XBC6_9PEZI
MPGITTKSQSWSDFAFTSQREEDLRTFVLPKEKYKRYGYRREKFSYEELLHKFEAYCKRCKAFALKPNSGIADYEERLKCKIHPGRKLEQEKAWACCGNTTVTYPGEPTGCQTFPRHDWNTDSPLPRGFWELHVTPPFKQLNNIRSKRARVAVSLDCEMATNRFNQPELIKLTLIDMFTKEVLIDSLVKPQAKIKNMLTSIHGISFKDISAAVSASTAVPGRDAAREKLFEFIGPETMVFVHGGTNDFLCLRWVHPTIVDTQEVESRIKRIGDDELDAWLDDEGTGLEAMCRVRAGVKIRTGTGIHDSLEDAMACRELGVWYASNMAREITLEAEDLVEVTKESKAGKKEAPVLEVSSWPQLSANKPMASIAAVVPKVPVWVSRPVSQVHEIPPQAHELPTQSPPSQPNEPSHVDIKLMWECKVCRVRVPENTILQHRAEASHLNKLIKLVEQRGG